MRFEKKISANSIIVKVVGRLDTNTVNELEMGIGDLNGIENLVLDFEKLDYISSAGLRVVLKCKKKIDSTKIINCNPEVYEIFNMTGFSQIMQVEKAFRKISIENSEKIGEGFYGNIYRLDPETIVKVYKIPDSLDMIKREIGLAKKAFIMGVPTAIPYDIVKVGDLYGAVFELLNAKLVVDLIDSEEALDNFAKKSSDILKDMHSKVIMEGELPSRKKEIIKILTDCERFFSKETFNKLLTLLETIPETNTLLHCDFHVKNIMAQNDELLLIDMDTLSTGHPILEFGPMFATYEGYACIDKQNTDKFLGMPLNVTKKLFDKILRYYYDDKGEEELQEIKLKLSVISYLQVLKLRSTFEDSSDNTQKEEIEFCRNYLSEIVEKLDTLKY